MDEKREEQLIAIVKIILLATAAAALYKAETGWITPQELYDLLDGKINLPPGDRRVTLINAFKAQLALLDPPEQQKIIDILMTYIESNPEVTHMTQPSKVFEFIWRNMESERPIMDK